MPELKTIEIFADHIMKGDIVLMGEDEIPTSPIKTISRKTKYVWIDGEDGTKGRLSGGDTIKVRRSFQTDQEKAADMREATIDYLTTKINGYDVWFENAKKEYCEKIMRGFEVHWHDTESFYASQARYEIWRSVVNVMNGRKVDVRAATQLVADDILYHFMRDYRATSRSTSVVSNAMEDVRRGEEVKFIEDLRWRTDIQVEYKRIDL